MYDPDPQRPALRLGEPRKASVPVKVDTSGIASFAEQLDRYLAKRTLAVDALNEAIAAGCAISDVRHEGDHVIAKLSFDAGAAINRLKALSVADADLSGALNSAL